MTPKTRTIALALMSLAAAVLAAAVPPITAWSLAASIGLALAAVLFALHTISRRLWNLEEKVTAAHRINTMSVASELHSMQMILNRFPQCTIPTTECSMRFANLHAIVDLLDRLQPLTVVEFGSGLSTLCVAAWMEERGRGRIVSFDHDAGWAVVTRRYLSQHRLDEFAEIITAPLSRTRIGARTQDWYDVAAHLGALSDIGLVIVDGPPAGSAETSLSRLPALPALYDRLAPTAVIVLDDAQRPGETEVVQQWLAEFPEFTLRRTGGVTGTAVLTRQEPPQPSRPHTREAVAV